MGACMATGRPREKPGVQFSTEFVAALRPKVTAALQTGSQTDVDEAMVEYLAFMTLMQLYDGVRLTPSQLVDEVWHAHILFTSNYRDWCQTHFGYFVDHAPTAPTVSRDRDLRCYATTLWLYQRVFGEAAPPKCWPVVPEVQGFVDELDQASETREGRMAYMDRYYFGVRGHGGFSVRLFALPPRVPLTKPRFLAPSEAPTEGGGVDVFITMLQPACGTGSPCTSSCGSSCASTCASTCGSSCGGSH
jgi:hypothetical protein